MKNHLSILLPLFLILLLSPSCDFTELDLLDDPNAGQVEQLDIEFLYNNIQLEFKDFFEATWELAPLSRMGHSTAFTYGQAFPSTTGDNLWTIAYSEILPDIDALEKAASNRPAAFESATSKILKAYTLFSLVDMFGDVPLGETIQGYALASPKSESGASIYEQAQSILDEAIEILENPDINTVENDLYYNGNTDHWIALANTLKIRAFLSTRLLDPLATQKALEIAASSNIIDDASEDFVFDYGNQRLNPNTRHPFYNAAYESNDPPYLSNYYMWLLADEKPVVDPRLRFYFYRQGRVSFRTDPNLFNCVYNEGYPDSDFYPEHYRLIDPNLPYCVASEYGYYGRDHLNGSGLPPDGRIRTVFGLYPAGGLLDGNTYLSSTQGGISGKRGEGFQPILLSSYVQFMLAELSLAAGDIRQSQQYLELGLLHSFEKVLKTAAHINGYELTRLPVDGTDHPPTWDDIIFLPHEHNRDDYVDFSLNQFENATDNERLDILSKEYLIALWGNGLDAYNLYRRTAKPLNVQPSILPDGGEYPRSLLYPSVHVNLNKNASQKSGFTPVFWDTNDASLFR